MNEEERRKIITFSPEVEAQIERRRTKEAFIMAPVFFFIFVMMLSTENPEIFFASVLGIMLSLLIGVFIGLG